MQQWRDALNLVASFSGWNTQNFKTDGELVTEIVDFVCGKVHPVDIEFTMRTGDFGVYEATRKAMEEVMEALKDDKITVVGVYGMGGVGKTTMVEHVAAQARKKGIFDYVVMAVVSQIPNIERIQLTLQAKLLGHQNFPEIGRASRLYKEIMGKKNVLIILDDIWGFIDLPRIGIPSHDELKQRNSKVLITTRKLHVCSSMESQASIHLETLSEEDSWSLFLKKTGKAFESTNFVEVAKKVAGECKGLPIALIAVARALRDKNRKEWEKAAEQLKKSQIANPDHEDDAFRCIKLSYEYLNDENYKSCFLLCCLFPEDQNIPIEYMFKYAIGKGLFQHTDTIYEARGLANSVVKHLKDSSLLLEGEYYFGSRYVRVHDVIRDTAIRIAKSEDGHGFFVRASCGLDKWPCRSHESYSAISLMKNKICRLPDELVCPNLQILLLNDNDDLIEIPETFLQSANELRVLDLRGTSISLLPQSFSHLTNLQALYLDDCRKMIDFSVLGKLQKLEILTMRRCPLEELPREIEHLTNLRLLDFGGLNGIVTIPSKVILKLHKLEELYMVDCEFRNWGRQIGGNCISELCMLFCGLKETNIDFDELAGLPKLTNLQVSIEAECIPENVEVEPCWVYFHICIGRPLRGFQGQFCEGGLFCERGDSRFLHLCGTTSISTLPGWFVNAVTSKTEKLEYNCCKVLSDIVKEFDHGRLHELTHLKVVGDPLDHFRYMEEQIEKLIFKTRQVEEPVFVKLKELINTTRRVQEGPVFVMLEEVHLRDLAYLKELCVGELPPGSLCNLKVLITDSCKALENVSVLIHRLPNLEKLYLNDNDDLQYVFEWEGFQPEQSKLREMHLCLLNAMKSICRGPPTREMLQSLKILTISECEVLQSLFASDVAECLVQLEDLLVDRCPLLERVIEEVNNKKMVLPKLKNLVLTRLPKLYGASGTADIECPSLKNLIMVDCPHFSFSATSENLESMNPFSFSASDYFGSKIPVRLNDQQIHEIICKRLMLD